MVIFQYMIARYGARY